MPKEGIIENTDIKEKKKNGNNKSKQNLINYDTSRIRKL